MQTLSWTLCIATLDRRDTLLAALDATLAQTRPPERIVIVDASDDWSLTRDAVTRRLARRPEIALDYRPATVRSSAVQRNEAIARATGDIVFLLDDDSFLYPDAAERILDLYEADRRGAVAAISARIAEDPPRAEATAGLERKRSGRAEGRGLRARVLATPLGAWLNRKVLLQSIDELFLRYDGPATPTVPAALAGRAVHPMNALPGCAITVRRAVALAEPFDQALRYYAAFEDLDVTYRYARHGALLEAEDARLHHFEAVGGRIGRRNVIVFQLLNMAVFLKRHAADPGAWRGRYRRLLARRLLGETLKDLLSGRPGLPQARGVLLAMRRWRQIWGWDAARIDTAYPALQRAILEGGDGGAARALDTALPAGAQVREAA